MIDYHIRNVLFLASDSARSKNIARNLGFLDSFLRCSTYLLRSFKVPTKDEGLDIDIDWVCGCDQRRWLGRG